VDLVEVQQDAIQFISMFATAIATSMPHIYLSGLTFAPASSLLYQKWHGTFPGVAKLSEGRLQDWPKMRLILEGHHEPVWSVAFSPDGKQIASSSLDIRLWDAETGARIGQPMEGHDDAILSIAFSPDGKQIASGSLDKTIRLWNVETGASIGQPMEGHHDAIVSIAFSRDGKQFASGSLDKTI
jgi:WD40 repeat protein